VYPLYTPTYTVVVMFTEAEELCVGVHKEQRMQTYKSRKYQKYLCNIIHLNLTKRRGRQEEQVMQLITSIVQ